MLKKTTRKGPPPVDRGQICVQLALISQPNPAHRDMKNKFLTERKNLFLPFEFHFVRVRKSILPSAANYNSTPLKKLLHIFLRVLIRILFLWNVC